MPIIAPWLHVTPKDFLEAAASGANAGIAAARGRASATLEAASIAERANEAAANRDALAQREANELALRHWESNRRIQQQAEKLAVNRERIGAELGLRRELALGNQAVDTQRLAEVGRHNLAMESLGKERIASMAKGHGRLIPQEELPTSLKGMDIFEQPSGTWTVLGRPVKPDILSAAERERLIGTIPKLQRDAMILPKTSPEYNFVTNRIAQLETLQSGLPGLSTPASEPQKGTLRTYNPKSDDFE